VQAQYPDGAPMSKLKFLSDKTIREFQLAIAPDMAIMKKGQNERRREATCDIYNFVSLAACQLMVYSYISAISIREMEALSMDELQRDPRWLAKVDRRLVFNIDRSTTFLGDDEDQLGFVAADSKAKLRERSRNATFTKTGKEDTTRGMGYTALTSADGSLVAFISHVRDHAYNGTPEKKRHAEIHQVSCVPPPLPFPTLPIFNRPPPCHS
jgi:hypothetical protein